VLEAAWICLIRTGHRNGDSSEGFTTAASMRLVAAIGVAVAMCPMLPAARVTIITLVLLRLIGVLTRKRCEENHAPPHHDATWIDKEEL
jgi:uncharacterized membrane protein YhiD involved in acid resistance